jgi:hypothetical protein
MAILLWGIPEGDDFTWDYTFKFKTEEGIIETTGFTTAYPKYSYPTRELKFSLGVTGEDTLERMSAFLHAGVTIVTTPLWFFRASLLSDVPIGTTEILVSDPSEFYVGEQALIMRANQPSVCELMTITGVAGSTVYVTATVHEYHPFTGASDVFPYYYDIFGAWIMPVISGILEYEGLEYVSGLPALGMKAKIDGGAWNSFTIPSMPEFTGLAMDAKYNSPKIVRDLCGVENGIISMYAHGDSSKLAFECTWHFKDSNWKVLRDMFFAARGKAQSFFMSTNMYELTTTRGADAGSTTIYLSSGYQYLWERFPYLLSRSRRDGTLSIINVTGHVYRDEFSCTALSYELYDGDRVCFYPQVRFDSDELTFNFKGVNMCYVKAIFIEEPS